MPVVIDPNTQLAEMLAEIKSQRTEIAELKKAKSASGKTGDDLRVAATAADPKEDGRWGTKSLDHFLHRVREAAYNPARNVEFSEHIQKYAKADAERKGIPKDVWEKAAQQMGEGVGPDGGFLLAPTYVDGVLEIAHKEDTILGMCDQYEMASPRMVLRAVDETSRAAGSRRGGVRGYWPDEGSSLTASKPKFRNIELVPHKVIVYTYATDELLQDTSMLEQLMSRYAAEELNFQVGNSIINGTGAGQPLGVLNHACLVSVSKETGQTAATVVLENINKMHSRLHHASRANAMWFINQDVMPQIQSLSLGIGTAGVAAYMPPGGLSEKPYATLLGRPVTEIEYCQTLGTVGDILLLDLKQYILATRGGVMAANSVHVAFATDETAFRWTWRVAGSGWWNSAITPFSGSNTQSPFISLATRS